MLKKIAPFLATALIGILVVLRLQNQGPLFVTQTKNAIIVRNTQEFRAPFSGILNSRISVQGGTVTKDSILFVIDTDQNRLALTLADHQKESISTTKKYLEDARQIMLQKTEKLQLSLAICEEEVKSRIVTLARYTKLNVSKIVTLRDVEDRKFALQKVQRECLRLGTNIEEQRENVAKLSAEISRIETQFIHNAVTSEVLSNIHNKAIVTAPYDGVVDGIIVTSGSYVEQGDVLGYIVSSDNVWVRARFREDQMKDVTVGQRVQIRTEMYPSDGLSGTIEKIFLTTEAEASDVPSLQASGAFTQLTQWVPVHITLDDTNILAKLPAGATCTVYINNE